MVSECGHNLCGWITNPVSGVVHLQAYHYLRRGFAFDCFTVLPFEVIASLCHASTTVIAVCRFNRICRCYKINQYFAHAERTVGVTTTSNTYAKFSLLALLALNFMASLWALASTVEDGTEDSWVSNTKYAGQHASALHTYVMALYWSTATMTSVGYGDVHAHTVFEMGLATMTMLLGAVQCGMSMQYPWVSSPVVAVVVACLACLPTF